MDYTFSITGEQNPPATETQSEKSTQKSAAPLISVIIPTRNKEAVIAATLDSVLNQPYRHLEIIVVDEGSTDDTALALEPYYDRIRYIYLESDDRSGGGRALNAGIQAASGEYVHGLAAGDRVTETYYIRIMQEFHARPHIGAVVTDAYRIGERGALTEILKRGHFESQQDFLLEGLDHNPIIASTAVVKRFCYEAVGPYRPEFEVVDEYDFWLRLGAQFEIAYLKVPLIQCRAWSTEQSWNLPRVWALEHKVVREFRRQTAIETFFPELRQRPEPERYAQAYERLGRIFNRKGWRDDAEREFEQADTYRAAATALSATATAGAVEARKRILFVLHDTLPYSPAGTALHTIHLAQALQAAGHSVVVLYPNYESTQPEGSLSAGRYEGLQTYSIAINASDFILNARNDAVAKTFNGFLQEHSFDFVHFQHLLHLGGALTEVAKKQQVPMVEDLQVLYGQLIKSETPARPPAETPAAERRPAPAPEKPPAAEISRPDTTAPSNGISAPAINPEARRIRVALYTLDQMNYACPVIRVVSPLTAASCAHRFQLTPAVAFQDGTVTVKDCIPDADVIVLQRSFPRVDSVDQLVAYAKDLRKPIVYETDDNLINLPEGHPQKAYYDAYRDRIIRVVSQADMVTVSTPKLRELFRRFNPNVAVLPNLIDLNLWSATPPPRTDERLALVYMGTLTHEEDLKMIAPALKQILQKYQGRVVLRFWGYVPHALRHVPGVESVGHVDNNYLNFIRDFCGAHFDIALAPLTPTEFNRYKSHIKYLEYSACRIPGVYARLEPYAETVRHGVTGLLAGSDPQEWVAALERLIEDEAFRRTVAENAYQDVVANHSVGARAQEWVTLYEQLLGRAAHRPAAPAAAVPAVNTTPAAALAPKVSIVIPVFNKADYTRKCLEALFANTAGSRYEVLVVDNGSRDETPALLDSYQAKVRVIHNETNLGFAKACNQGARAARGEHIVFLNNDTLPQAGWLDALVALAEQDRQAGIIGAKLLYPNETVQHAGVIFSVSSRLPYHIYRNFDPAHPAVNRVREFPAVTGACMLAKRSVLFEAGLFDENYVNCYEDVDLCLRVAELGYKILYNPRSVVYHYESVTEGRKDRDSLNHSFTTFRSKWGHKLPTDETEYYAEDDLQIEYLDENNLKISPLSPAEQCLNRARRLKSQGRFAEAMRALETLTEERYRFDVCTLRGDCCAHLGQTDAAATHYQTAISLNAQNERPYVGLGVLAVQSHRLEEARAYFERALTLNPQSDTALCGLGITWAGLGRAEEALEKYTQALDVNPRNMTALSNLQALAYEKKTFGLAEHYFRRYLALRPGDLGVQFGLAGIYAMMGNTSDARATLHRILKLDPDYKDAAALLHALDTPSLGSGASPAAAVS